MDQSNKGGGGGTGVTLTPDKPSILEGNWTTIFKKFFSIVYVCLSAVVLNNDDHHQQCNNQCCQRIYSMQWNFLAQIIHIHTTYMHIYKYVQLFLEHLSELINRSIQKTNMNLIFLYKYNSIQQHRIYYWYSLFMLIFIFLYVSMCTC